MLAALLVVFREMLEASLVLGIVFAATRGVPHRGRWLWGGVAAGVVGAVMLAYVAGALSAALAGAGQEIFNASILGVAVLMLAWHVIWMSRHGRAMSQHFKEFGRDVRTGQRTLLALAVVVGVAILREGAETVLFLYGILLSASITPAAVATGSIGGLLLGGMIGLAMYWGLLRVPPKYFFALTGLMVTVLAAGMAASAVGYLQQADVVTALTKTAWNSSHLLSQDSVIGTLLHALVGYIAQPTQAQVVAYGATLAVIFALCKRETKKQLTVAA